MNLVLPSFIANASKLPPQYIFLVIYVYVLGIKMMKRKNYPLVISSLYVTLIYVNFIKICISIVFL